MKTSSYLRLIIAIVVSELAGIAGSLASSAPTWYAGLAKPALNPPDWIFGPVWVVLYALMGVAAFLVWDKGWERADVRKALRVFLFQLALNAAWSIIFFGLHSPFWAYVDITAMWLAILWTMILFRKTSKPASWLLAPYILWVSFAVYLNYSILVLNYRS
ncbi:MAG: tryptophan-rich sensory protein [Patescibacteria group bacterium]|nr:tryptophan-rich sensory protein [Patescibacteria group bacterium]MDE2116408.1 tryptophan-rich sensory protein [Patescibacteria group bacterium]